MKKKWLSVFLKHIKILLIKIHLALIYRDFFATNINYLNLFKINTFLWRKQKNSCYLNGT